MSLRARFTTSAGALHVHADVDAAPGAPVAIIGPNGAGKTTIVRALCGLHPLESGQTVLGDRVLDDVTARISVPSRERDIGVVFQDRALIPHMDVLENVAFGLRARGVTARTARGRAAGLLERMGIGHRASARPHELSGGEAQRVAIARAIIHNPRLLLLDEPLAGLDARSLQELRALLREILSTFEAIAIVVTHDPVDAMTLADRIVVLEDGRVTQTGTAREIREAPRTPFGAEFVGVNQFIGRLEPLLGGSGTLTTESGTVVVSWPPEIRGPADGVLGLLRPADVSLFIEQPSASSARNILRGTVRSITGDGERARVRLDSSPPLVAEVTTGSIARLQLKEGAQVWASFKAVEVRVIATV